MIVLDQISNFTALKKFISTVTGRLESLTKTFTSPDRLASVCRTLLAVVSGSRSQRGFFNKNLPVIALVTNILLWSLEDANFSN